MMLVLGGIYVAQPQAKLLRWWHRYLQPATAAAPVFVYGTCACEICEKTVAMLEEAGVRAELVSIDDAHAARAERV
jgi:hypothetical protein